MVTSFAAARPFPAEDRALARLAKKSIKPGSIVTVTGEEGTYVVRECTLHGGVAVVRRVAYFGTAEPEPIIVATDEVELFRPDLMSGNKRSYERSTSELFLLSGRIEIVEADVERLNGEIDRGDAAFTKRQKDECYADAGSILEEIVENEARLAIEEVILAALRKEESRVRAKLARTDPNFA